VCVCVCVKELRKLNTQVSVIDKPTKFLLVDTLVSGELKISSRNITFCLIFMGYSLF
jgi:hypothetical protein